jgi:hypothetical protein
MRNSFGIAGQSLGDGGRRPLRLLAGRGLVACALLLGACSPPPAGEDVAAQGKTPGVLLPIFHAGWNGAWDRYDAGALRNMPAVATNGRVWDMVTIGSNQHLNVRESSDGVHWGAAVDLGGSYSGTPGIAFCRTALVVAALDNAGAAWSFTRSLGNGNGNGAWGGATSMGGYLLGGIGLIGNPTGYGVTAVGIGGNYQMWELTGSVGLWSSRWLQQTSGYTLAPIAPTGVTLGNGRIDILAASNTMVPLHEWETNGVVGGWEPLNGVQMGQGSIVATGPTTFAAYVIGTDRSTYQDIFDGTRWDGFTKIFGCSEGDGAYAVAPYPFSSGYGDTTDLYVLGMDHSAIYHNRWSLFPSTAAGQQPYCCGLPNTACCGLESSSGTCADDDTATGNYRCNPADNKCEQCGSAVGQACCLNESGPSGEGQRCGLGGSNTVCDVYNRTCVSASAPQSGPYEICGSGGTCAAGYTCAGRNAMTGDAGYCKPATTQCGGDETNCISDAACCAGFLCNLNRCTQSSRKTCGGNAIADGSAVYLVDLRDAVSGCALDVIEELANSAAEAYTCAATQYPNAQVLNGSTYPWASYDYAVHTSAGLCWIDRVAAFQPGDAGICVSTQNPGSTYVLNGSCP